MRRFRALWWTLAVLVSLGWVAFVIWLYGGQGPTPVLHP